MTAALPKDATVAVIGAGTMGVGHRADRRAPRPPRPAARRAARRRRTRAKKAIAEALANASRRAGSRVPRREAALARIATVGHAAGRLRRASWSIEAIVEDLDAKRELFARVENVVVAGCILASNTSSLSITALAAGMKRPERVVGMHFFNPAPLMPLVEVVSGLATGARCRRDDCMRPRSRGARRPCARPRRPDSSSTAARGRSTPKALRLLAERAADPATLDAVIRDAGGFRMGPFELIDLIGLDVNLAVTTSVWEAYFHDPRYAPSVAAARARRRRLSRPQDGSRLLRLRAGRGEAGSATRSRSSPRRHASSVHGEHRLRRPRSSSGWPTAGVAVERARADSRVSRGRDPRCRRCRRRVACAHRRAHGDRARRRDAACAISCCYDLRARLRDVRRDSRVARADTLRRCRVRAGRRRAAGGRRQRSRASTTSPGSR